MPFCNTQTERLLWRDIVLARGGTVTPDSTIRQLIAAWALAEGATVAQTRTLSMRPLLALISVLRGVAVPPEGGIRRILKALAVGSCPDATIWMLLVRLAGNIAPPGTISLVVLSDGAGGFCQLVVDVNGNVGAYSSAGPAIGTAPVIADGSGGFWQIVTNGSCERGTTSVAGPATAPVVLMDSNSVAWTLVVAPDGSLGATS